MEVTINELLKVGAHFGHRARYWNPKMRKYIYGTYNNIHVIDLSKTLVRLRQASETVYDIARRKNKILFVGTKKTARELIRRHAQSIDQCYVNHRWMGGMLTNYKTVSASIEKLKELEKKSTDGSLDQFTKKEAMMRRREMLKLERNIGGIRDMGGLPDALFIIDINHEHIAAAEAIKLGIPVIAVVDTNSDPSQADYAIPGNDDSVKAIELYLTAITDSFKQGTKMAEEEGMGPGRVKPDWQKSSGQEHPERPIKKTNKETDRSDNAPQPQPEKHIHTTLKKRTGAAKEQGTERTGTAGTEAGTTGDNTASATPKDTVSHSHSNQDSRGAIKAITQDDNMAMADKKPIPNIPASDISAATVKKLREVTGAGILDCKRALIETGGDSEKAIEQLRITGKVKALKKADRDALQGLLAVHTEANTATIARINCETDFVARNADMISLAETLAVKSYQQQCSEPDELFKKDNEAEKLFADTRQKMGENIILAPFIRLGAAKDGCVASYLHTNRRIAAIVAIEASDKPDLQLCYDLAMQVAAMSPQAVRPEDVSPAILNKEREIYMKQTEDEDKSPEIKSKMIEGRLKKYAKELSLSEQASIKDPKQKIGDLLKNAGVQKVAFVRCEIGQKEIRVGF